MIAFIYQKLLPGEISKKHSEIEKFSFFSQFCGKKAFELTYDCSIHYFAVVFRFWHVKNKGMQQSHASL